MRACCVERTTIDGRGGAGAGAGGFLVATGAGGFAGAGVGWVATGTAATGEGRRPCGMASPKPTDVSARRTLEAGRRVWGMIAAPSAATTVKTPSQARIRMGEQ